MSTIHFRKNDMILLGILTAVFLLVLMGTHIFKTPGRTVLVSIDGKAAISFDLSEEKTYEIEGYNGGSNLLIINDGKAWLEDSSCPDHLCEKMGKIDSVGESVICLPNRVTVEIVGGSEDEPEYDAIVGG